MALVGVVWIAVALSVALVICLGPRIERWFRTPKDLRGDWWPAFEHEFRAYATRSAKPRPRRRRTDRRPMDQ